MASILSRCTPTQEPFVHDEYSDDSQKDGVPERMIHVVFLIKLNEQFTMFIRLDFLSYLRPFPN